MKIEEMSQRQIQNMQRVFNMPFADVYPLYVRKVQNKHRSESELRTVLSWLTNLDSAQLEQAISSGSPFKNYSHAFVFIPTQC